MRECLLFAPPQRFAAFDFIFGLRSFAARACVSAVPGSVMFTERLYGALPLGERRGDRRLFFRQSAPISNNYSWCIDEIAAQRHRDRDLTQVRVRNRPPTPHSA